MSSITVSGGNFIKDGEKFRFIGGNNYPLIQSNYTSEELDEFFGYCVQDGISVVRCWCFNKSSTPTNSTGNFRYLNSSSVVNKVSNPGFESSSSGWSLGSDFTRDNTSPRTGTWAIKQSSASGFDNFTTVNDATGIPVDPNTDYVFGFYAKITVTTGLAPILELNKDSAYGSHIIESALSDTGGSYQLFLYNFNSGSNSKVYIRIYNNNGNITAYYDDFFIQVQPTLEWVESTFVSLDRVLDRAKAAGIKLILPVTDNYGSQKEMYEKWSDDIYMTSYRTTTTNRTITSLTRSGTTATATTSGSHGFSTGQLVNISGASPSGYNVTGAWIKVLSSTQFTYQVSSSLTTPATGSPVVSRPAFNQAFYDDPNIRTMYKEFIDKLTSRTNTINGISYIDDDTIFSWELGNELRYDQGNDPYINTSSSTNIAALCGPGGWADVMSTYFKSKDPNHLVSYGDCGHFWNYVSGDYVYNGSYYGVDYNLIGQLPNVDYLDFHLYVYEDHPSFALRAFGVYLGYSTTPTAEGLTAQIKNFVSLAKSAGKPCVVGEWGVDKRNTVTTPYTAYPREAHFDKLFTDFFDVGGDGLCIWHYTSLFDDNNYNIYPAGIHTGSNTSFNVNDDDTGLRQLISRKNTDILSRSTKPGVWER